MKAVMISGMPFAERFSSKARKLRKLAKNHFEGLSDIKYRKASGKDVLIRSSKEKDGIRLTEKIELKNDGTAKYKGYEYSNNRDENSITLGEARNKFTTKKINKNGKSTYETSTNNIYLDKNRSELLSTNGIKSQNGYITRSKEYINPKYEKYRRERIDEVLTPACAALADTAKIMHQGVKTVESKLTKIVDALNTLGIHTEKQV